MFLTSYGHDFEVFSEPRLWPKTDSPSFPMQSAECSSSLHTQTRKLSDKSQEGSFLEMKLFFWIQTSDKSQKLVRTRICVWCGWELEVESKSAFNIKHNSALVCQQSWNQSQMRRGGFWRKRSSHTTHHRLQPASIRSFL